MGNRGPVRASAGSKARGRWIAWGALSAAGGWALWATLRRVDFTEVEAVWRRLTWPLIGFLLGINVLVMVVLSLRWWAILRARGHRPGLVRLAAYRLAGFSVSYLTPGPHLGGEPVQAFLLSRGGGISPAESTASVVLDKGIELVANSAFLLVGVAVLLRRGLLPSDMGPNLVAAPIALAAFPLVYLAGVWRGARPVTRLLTWLAARLPAVEGPARVLCEAEALVGEFCRQSPMALAKGLAFAALGWVALLVEYGWMQAFLGIRLDWGGRLAGLAAARLALLLPIPGALGVLEASQILALTSLGFHPAEGAALGLLIRGRDIAFAAVGLAAGGWLAGRRPVRRDC